VGANSDRECGSGRLGGELATRTEWMAQRVVRAVAAAPLPTGRVRVEEGGIADGKPAAGSMMSAINFTGFIKLRDGYLEYCVLEEQSCLELQTISMSLPISMRSSTSLTTCSWSDGFFIMRI
jgi:hypothetical protein